MVTPSGGKGPAVIQQLFSKPYQFDFFQAVRLLERAAGAVDGAGTSAPVGHDSAPAREVARFRAAPALSFPAGSIVELRASNSNGAAPPPAASAEPHSAASASPAHMTVAFMGLTGPSGVLPVHYTRMLIERSREKDYSIRDFFDLFNHRLISLFYRSWEKYRFLRGYERSRLSDQSSVANGAKADLFTSCLHCLTGMGTDGLRDRMTVDDESFLLYGGFFADSHRSAVALERTLADYFELPAFIDQFQGQWLNLGPDDLSRLPGGEHPKGLNHQLGVTTVLGDRVWDVQSRFRVRLGPLSYEQYCRFTPAGDGLEPICQLARTYVGPQFDFDVQPILKAEAVPATQLGSVLEVKPMLGWNVWLKSQAFDRDFADASFSRESI
ncbi:MAG: type VI secretion system baseplate subunit TssG [Phycisphaerales bacterium]|nr:type VI secretion system baseplate subunit TssG [Phycisphaerales bacterium]MCI0629484.1 type VI secretion system baseplate subunit TssG [Phycisphaerales bacterium]MCI0674746.1 type VI secretion system baseplate subunit TssG [Phycisphaerales bacterium]